jgi:hypothetical protein
MYGVYIDVECKTLPIKFLESLRLRFLILGIYNRFECLTLSITNDLL